MSIGDYLLTDFSIELNEYELIVIILKNETYTFTNRYFNPLVFLP